MASSLALPSSTGPTLGFDDYSLYSNLSDEELMQLAIERSLSDAHSTAATVDSNKNPTPLSRPQPPARPPNSPARPPNPPARPPNQLSRHNPPVNPPDFGKDYDGTVSYFTTGNGKHMMRYRRIDGTIEIVPGKIDPIVKAIYDGDVTAVRAMASLPGGDLMAPNESGWLPMHEAAYSGQAQCLVILLGAQPGMINKCTLKGQTALLLAVDKERVDCVEVLLGRGADTEKANKEQDTPLYKACEKQNAAIVAMLLNHGARTNRHCVQGWTALHEAVCHKNIEICEMLVKAGAKLNAKNIYGISPIFTSAQSGCVETLRFLIKNGADVNSEAGDGATALYEAAKNGHEDIVELLLSQNADANKPGKTGLLPLHIAAQRGNDVIVSMLIPATRKTRVCRTGISPLHLAAERNRDEVLELLIQAGFDVNAKLSPERSDLYEDRRSTALYFAVINNNIEATQMLLDAGANPNLDIFSPLLVAVRQGCIKTVVMLVEHGADVNAHVPTHPTSFPATVMFCMKYLSMLKLMMDNGCDALSCFNCTYGSGPHPPIKIERSERDESRFADTSPRQKTCVQFCELISAPSISRWAGPIIDVLLDYVGDVKLCSRLLDHLNSYPDWDIIKDKSTPPRPLLQLCRLKIRQQLGIQRLKYIDTLPLPGRLIKFLNHLERTADF